MKTRAVTLVYKLFTCSAIIILLLNTVALAAPMSIEIVKSNTAVPQILDGSFFQPSLVTNWTETDFSDEYNTMRSVGMNHIIWQWTVDSKQKQAYYPTKLLGSQASSKDLVGVSLKQAEKKGMKVWLGLNWNDDWFKYYANNEKWLTNEVALNKRIVQELWRLYGNDYGETIAGFYLPMEVDNVHFRDEKKQKRLAMAYKEIAEAVHNVTGKPVMTAPFFNPSRGQDAREYAEMWGSILKNAPIDVIALQDGFGGGYVTTAIIEKWLAALGRQIKNVRPMTQLWSDLETFTPEFLPASIERVISQINAEQKYITKFTSFSFNHYDSPNQGNLEVFRQYKKYVDSLP